MSTYQNTREVYESAADAAATLNAELKHMAEEPFDIEEWWQERIIEEADRLCIWTQDNWDVCNLFRCSPEYDMADEVPLSEFGTIDSYFTYVAHNIWCQLINDERDA